MLKLITGDDLALLSHPPHLDLNSRVTSALIPFCGFKTSMVFSESTTWLPDISYPICSAFKPTILEGQLCYKIEVNATSGQGKRNQLMLLLDYSEDRSIYAPMNQAIDNDHSKLDSLNMDDREDIDSKEAKIHIGTLSSFKGFGGGTYKMTVVKEMTVTDDFLKMPLVDRKCDIEPFEECRTRKLGEVCNCVHLAAHGKQVKIQLLDF